MNEAPRRVVVLFGATGSASPGSSLAAETSRLRALLQERPHVTVITRGLARDFAGADHLESPTAHREAETAKAHRG